MVYARTPNTRLDRTVADEPVDLNTASAEELREIEGIGEGRAARIVEWRAKNGHFDAIEDLQKVHDFTAEDVARLRPRLRA